MKTCTKCDKDLDEDQFYKKKTICIDCFKEQVKLKRNPYIPKDSNLEPIPETIKTVPWRGQVNHELYQHLLKL